MGDLQPRRDYEINLTGLDAQQSQAWFCMIRISLLGLLVIVALSVFATTGTTTHAAPAAQVPSLVEMQDNYFLPSMVLVPVGSTVTWVNSGSTPHTATADAPVDIPLFDIPLNPGESGEYTFVAPGTYAYHCTFHGAEGMLGMIEVQ